MKEVGLQPLFYGFLLLTLM